MSQEVDRFHAAVSVLAGNGNVKQRLMMAYERHLDDLGADDLPVTLRQEFADLRSMLYRVAPIKGESAVRASVRKMSIGEASECAVALVSLYRQMVRHGEGGQRVLPLDPDSRKPIPPFLVKSS